MDHLDIGEFQDKLLSNTEDSVSISMQETLYSQGIEE
jgi:hypothetical protein